MGNSNILPSFVTTATYCDSLSCTNCGINTKDPLGGRNTALPLRLFTCRFFSWVKNPYPASEANRQYCASSPINMPTIEAPGGNVNRLVSGSPKLRAEGRLCAGSI